MESNICEDTWLEELRKQNAYVNSRENPRRHFRNLLSKTHKSLDNLKQVS